MLPAYERCCHRQECEFDGVNLAEKQRKAICVCAPEMCADSIQPLGSERFYVRSASDPKKMYLVDLGKDCSSDLSNDYLIASGKDCCDCPDWPRAWLCKHIAIIAHSHTLANDTTQPTAPNTVPQECESSQDSYHGKSPASDASTIPILEHLISVSRDYLSDAPPSSLGTVCSLWLVESHLTAMLQSLWALQSPLPDQESLPPNRSTWTKTAERMGAKCQKRSRPTNTLPTVPASQQIGNLNWKQARVKNPNPYSSSLWSGKDADPDTQTAAQNADAHACVATASDVGPPPPKWQCKHAESLPPLPSSAPPPTAFSPCVSVPTPSASLAWYPIHPAYHPSTYSYTPLPVFWHIMDSHGLCN